MKSFGFVAILSCFSAVALVGAINDASPVSVQLSYESCCPYCQEFITGTFKTAWSTEGFSNITTIQFLPYGNAEERYDSKTGLYNFTCQHGKNECRGNLVESCYMGLNNFDAISYIPFIIAFEEKLDDSDCRTNAYDIAKDMISDYGMSWDTLHACIDSKEGNDFEHEMASDTPSDHEYVPWIVVDDVHNQIEQNECQDDILACVCERYKGTSPACDKYNNDKRDPNAHRSYKPNEKK